MLRIVTLKWGVKFQARHVNVLRNMVKRHLPLDHEFVCITDNPAGLDDGIRVIPLYEHWRRLEGHCQKLLVFSPEMEQLVGPRFLVIDLDSVVVGDLAPLVSREEDFVIWRGRSASTLYNSSLMLIRAGSHAKVYTSFHPVESRKVIAKLRAKGARGHDQVWIGACLGPKLPTWRYEDGVLDFKRDVVKKGKLPKHARIVFFSGHYDPSEKKLQKEHPWIAKHWR